MDGIGSVDRYQAFFASREAAVVRMRAPAATFGQQTSETGKFLTPPTRQSDPVSAALSAGGPTKGRRLDLIA